MRESGISAIVVVIIAVVVIGGALAVVFVPWAPSGGESGLPSGTATITLETDPPFTPSGFDFSAGTTADSPDADFAIEPWFGWYGQSGATPAVQGYTGIDNLVQDMGETSLGSVTTAPETGYSADAHALAGHVYVIKCRENTYAKIRFTSITFTAGDYPATFTFDWVYQPDGSRTLA